ncbi:unnamed protein product [Phaedon cochleariae]|uniref:Double jelly roll-like domain-containing protein n=1 Tax=Phaedon cochleariae TaxID=80249 RepID=A0A9N9SDZ3_PHACE|nr:unnamed protein product [Phaedon cochleariae]
MFDLSKSKTIGSPRRSAEIPLEFRHPCVDKQNTVPTNVKGCLCTSSRGCQNVSEHAMKVVERANTALQGSPQTQSIAKITIESINLKVPHLTPNDDIKLQLLTRIKADESMMIPFRRWELHELPALTQGSTIEIWSVKTCSALDSPRYVIVFFQTKKADNLHEDVTLFDNANIKSIRLALNSDYYPQERMLLDFSRDQYADAHFNYTEFNKSYHNCQEKRSLVNFAEFKSRPMFVIDCSRRHLGQEVNNNESIKSFIGENIIDLILLEGSAIMELLNQENIAEAESFDHLFCNELNQMEFDKELCEPEIIENCEDASSMNLENKCKGNLEEADMAKKDLLMNIADTVFEDPSPNSDNQVHIPETQIVIKTLLQDMVGDDQPKDSVE